MTVYTGEHNRPTSYKRGDTIPAFAVQVKDHETGTVVIPTNVCMQLRDGYDDLVYEFNTISDYNGWILIEEIGANLTKTFKPGLHVYDIELTLRDGRHVTYLEGIIEIKGDVSRC